jgi:G3E family GTPase
MGIESPLILDEAGQVFDKIYEMPNGCLCCSAKTDLL